MLQNQDFWLQRNIKNSQNILNDIINILENINVHVESQKKILTPPKSLVLQNMSD